MLKSKISIFSSLLFLLCFTTCSSQDQSSISIEKKANNPLVNIPSIIDLPSDEAAQIGEYIVALFEDSKGILWIGTMSKGVARYDASLPKGVGQGKSLTYFTTEDGVANNAVVSIEEDKKGNLWFGTHSGLSKYDGNKFTNFDKKNGLQLDQISNILIDKTGSIWIGSWGGVTHFDGTTFTEFPLPNPDIKIPPYQETENWVTEIIEDRQGNIWFGRSGYGACKYDGKFFTHFTKKDGLASNCIQDIEEDNEGNIWFTSRVAEKDHPDADKRSGDGGLTKYTPTVNQANNNTFTQFPELEGLSKNDIYNIYKDKRGDLWIGANNTGLYRYDGKDFTLFSKTDRPDLNNNLRGIQSLLEDKNGNIWIGCSGGLYRLNGTYIINVTQDGPWK